MNEGCLFKYVGIPILICLLLCGLIFPSIAISHNDFETKWDTMGVVIALVLSVAGTTGSIILLIFWAINKYAANKALYSMDGVFPQDSVCEDTTLINEQTNIVVSV
jgi:hypothetical protein